ncbi:MAG: DUF4440 domain-containing protein [Acidobacteria bacterium]|nr:DUF4440 domain-containing protein [Acidobacteriota bacterium]
MKRIILAVLFAVAMSGPATGQRGVARQRAQQPTGDAEKLEQVVREWADAVLPKLERIKDDSFKGTSEGMNFSKRMFLEALKSGAVKVAAWTIEDVKVSVRGNSAVVTGRTKLNNAVHMGKDYNANQELKNTDVENEGLTLSVLWPQLK